MESTGLPSVQAEVIHLLEMIHHFKDPPTQTGWFIPALQIIQNSLYC